MQTSTPTPSSPKIASKSPFETFIDRRHFGSLDGIRCLSIVAVVLHHSKPASWTANPPLTVISNLFLGVDIFFVLSGFLIVTLILRERRREGDFSLKNFYLRRVFRIFPIYYLLVAVVGALALMNPGGATAKTLPGELPYLLTFTSNWVEIVSLLGVTWSLSTEEQFYMLWPPIEKVLNRGKIPFLIAFIGLNQLVNFRLADSFLEGIGLHYDQLSILQSTFTPICLGVLLAHALDTPRGFERLRSWFGHPAVSLLALGAVVGLASIPGDIAGWPRLSIHLLITVFLASCVVNEDHILAPLFKIRWICRIGTISYGMYLYHMLIVHQVHSGLARFDISFPFDVFILTLLGTILVAEISFRTFEAWFLKQKQRFR